MRKRIAGAAVCFAASLRLQRGAEPSDGYVLYFQERDLRSAAGEGALRTESVQLEPTEAPARALLEALLAGPTDETLKNAIPAGTSCCPWS